MRTPKHYEIVAGSHSCGRRGFVIRIRENSTARGWVAISWGTSKADWAAIRRLVEQANDVFLVEALVKDKQASK